MTDRRAPFKVVFFGSPDFAVPSLRVLQQDPRFELALVVTQPDRRAGRGKSSRPPAVKVESENLGLKLIQPETVNDDEVIQSIRSIDADLFVVVAYSEKLGRNLLEAAPHGCLNVHPSLLPRYRGSSPIPAAILNGDAETGVSIIKLTRRLDAGQIVSQTVVKLHGNEYAGELSQDLSQIAASVLPDVANCWCRDALLARRQDHNQATFTSELTKADGRIDWGKSAERIERQVRAMSPWPGCWTVIDGRRLGIGSAAVEPFDEAASATAGARTEPGTLIGPESNDRSFAISFPGVVAATGVVRLLRVTPEGKREMSGADWWRGSRLRAEAKAELG